MSFITKVEGDVTSVVKTIELDFQSPESKALAFAAKSQKWTKQLQAWQGNATVEQIETMVGAEPEAQAIVAFLVAANSAIQLLLSQKLLDAINGTLLMLGSQLVNVLSGNSFSLGTAIAAFQKLWDMVA